MKLHLVRPASLAPCAALLAACTLAIAALGQNALPRDHVRATRDVAPLAGFVENKGQWDEGVLFHARSGAIGMTLGRGALVLRPRSELPRDVSEDGRLTAAVDERASVVLRFPSAAATIEGEGALATNHHFFVGGRSATNVLGYTSVLYRDLVPGVSLRVRLDAQRNFAYDVLAEPGARLERLEIAVEGAHALELREPGLLALATAFGPLEQRIGPTWQEDVATGARTELNAQFVLASGSAEGELRFRLQAPSWDRSQRLVIDPGLAFATYVGGIWGESLRGIEVAPDGSTFLLAEIEGVTDMPTTPGSYQPQIASTLGQGPDAWIGKLSSDASTLEWATFFGGSNAEFAYALDLASDGSIFVGGDTRSLDFPTTSGALQELHAAPPSPFGNQASTTSNQFVGKLASNGATLVWATLHGTSAGDEGVRTLVALPNGDVAIGGNGGLATSHPAATPGAFDPVFNAGDKMLMRLSADGSTKVFLTYFKAERILDMTTDADSNIHFCGYTTAAFGPLPTTPGVHQPLIHPGSTREAYVTKLDGSGSFLHWSTYLGGADGHDLAMAIAVDAAAAVYVAGSTDSDDFPVTPGAIDSTFSDPNVAGFVTKLLPDASGLAWSTYLGGCCAGVGGSISDVAIDVAGNAHVVAAGTNSNWPVTPDAHQPNYIGLFSAGDAYLAKLGAFGEELVYATWVGGSQTDYFPRLGISAAGHPSMAFLTYSDDLPATPGAYDPSLNSNFGDIFLASFELPLLNWRVLPGALKGSQSTPNLAGEGVLTAGQPTRLGVRGGPATTLAWGVVGASQANLPLFGGTVVPFPDLVVPLPKTNALGALDVQFAWPSLAAGSNMWFQVWMLDLAAPQLVCATNAVMAIAQ